MAEYIEKHKAVNLLTSLENEFQQFKPFKGFEHAMYRKLCETEIAIGKLPAADVVPVVHGRWTTKHYIDGIFEGTNFDECSACGYQRVFDDPALKTRYDYCPRCGAKMDGGAE